MAKLRFKNGVGVGNFFVMDVPNDIKSAFKAACARRSVTMKAVLVRFMKDYARGFDKQERR